MPDTSKTIVMTENAANKCFLLLCNITDANLFRLSKGVAVRLDNSPLVEKGLLHEHVR